MLADVSCIPAAAEYTANIQTQCPSPTLKNDLLLVHVIQRKDKSFPLSCYWFMEFKQNTLMWQKWLLVFTQNLSCLCSFVVVYVTVYLKCQSEFCTKILMCFLNWLQNCILYQYPITSKSTVGLGTLLKSCSLRKRCCDVKIMPQLSHHTDKK